MTIDEIIQKIYEERYVDPKDPEIASYMRDKMIREVVQRTLELAIGGIAIDLVAARRSWTAANDVAFEAGTMEAWRAFHQTEDAWRVALAKLDAWIREQPAYQEARAACKADLAKIDAIYKLNPWDEL